jgi:small subunit ribosomal protein S16
LLAFPPEIARICALSRPDGRQEFALAMVKIRLARAGAKKRPFYHVVATDSRKSRDGRFIERLGYYNPKAVGTEQRLVLDQARVEYWQKQGAQISDRVTFLIKHAPSPVDGGASKPVAEAAAA